MIDRIIKNSISKLSNWIENRLNQAQCLACSLLCIDSKNIPIIKIWQWFRSSLFELPGLRHSARSRWGGPCSCSPARSSNRRRWRRWDKRNYFFSVNVLAVSEKMLYFFVCLLLWWSTNRSFAQILWWKHYRFTYSCNWRKSIIFNRFFKVKWVQILVIEVGAFAFKSVVTEKRVNYIFGTETGG